MKQLTMTNMALFMRPSMTKIRINIPRLHQNLINFMQRRLQPTDFIAFFPDNKKLKKPTKKIRKKSNNIRSQQAKITPKPAVSRSELKVLTTYWYEDREMRRILEAEISKHKYKTKQGKPVSILGPIDNITSYDLELVLAEHSRKQGIVLIPFNKGGLHWVGLILEYDTTKKLIRADYYDSLGNNADKRLNVSLKNATQKTDPVRQFNVIKKGLITQKNGSDCGPCTIENLLAGIGYGELKDTPPHMRRLHHLLTLKIADKTPDKTFYRDFYNRQRLNQSSFSRVKTNKNILSVKELKDSSRLTTQQYHSLLAFALTIHQLPEKICESLITALVPNKSIPSQEHASMLGQIRAVFNDFITDEHVRPVIKRFFCLTKNTSSLEDAELKMDYNDILKLAVILSCDQDKVKQDLVVLKKDYPELFNHKVVKSNKASFFPHSVDQSDEKLLQLTKKKNQTKAITTAIFKFKGDLTELKQLKEHGVDFNKPISESLATPLMLATTSGKLKVVEYFLDENVTLNLQDTKGNTALHLAVQRAVKKSNWEIANCLLKKGALKLDCKNKEGFTAIEYAEQHGYTVKQDKTNTPKFSQLKKSPENIVSYTSQ